MIKRLFWDIETSPCVTYTWRTGYKLRIGHHMLIDEAEVICISYKWQGKDEVHTLTWDRGRDKDMIRQFLPILNQADQSIAHNGDKFDLRWFNTRCLLHGFDGSSLHKTLDTCKIAKSKFAFNSNSLQYIAQRLLGEGKHEHAGFDMWKEIVEDNCPEAMAIMVKYCEQDVLLLERVFLVMEKYQKPNMNVSVLSGGPKWACPYCGSKNVKKSKTRTTGAGTLQHQMLCHARGEYYQISNLAFTHYKKERYEEQNKVTASPS